MIACFKCGHDNQPGQKYCGSCGALLPQMAPSGATSNLELDEETEYVMPSEHFPTDEMLTLAWTLHDFLEEGAEIDPFLDIYELIKTRLENYNQNLHQESLDCIASDRNLDPEDPQPKQLQYLLVRASGLVEEGLALVERFLDGLDQEQLLAEDAKNGVSKIVQANDHFLMALHLSTARSERLTQQAEAHGLDLAKALAQQAQQAEQEAAQEALPE